MVATTDAIVLSVYPKQAAFVESDAQINGFAGGRGCGKSEIGSINLLSRALRDRFYLATAPTYPMLRDINIASALSVLQRLRPKPKFTWSKSDLILRIHDNGDSIIQFKSSEDPDMLRGVGLDWCWIDEASLMRAYVWDVLSTRLDKAWSRAWITTTPRGLDWVYEQFYLRLPRWRQVAGPSYSAS